MNTKTGAMLRESSRVVHLRRFATTHECTMPEGDEPCSRTECRYHLSNRQLGEHVLKPTRDCALEVANEGEHTLEATAVISGLTREWVRQIEGKALAKLAKSRELHSLHCDPRDVRSSAFAMAREQASELGAPIRMVFDDSFTGDLARLRLFARLRLRFPSMPARVVDELIQELFTP